MTPEGFAAILRECYAPELRRQLAGSVIWRSSPDGAAPITEAQLREAIDHASPEAGGVRSDRGAFVRAVEYEMRMAAAQLAQEAGGRLDEDGLFWPDAQVMTWDDDTEPFPF